MRVVHGLVGMGLLLVLGCPGVPGPWNTGGSKSPCDKANCGRGSVQCVEEDGEARCECWSGYTGPTCDECSPGYAKSGDTCVATCGDGQVNGSEVCDDGNNAAGDGCSPSCALETGYACHGEPSECDRIPTCGDRHLDTPEACDDGNTAAGDGCSPTCTVETGYGCRGEPSVCETMTCGDRVITGSETCDDGNLHDNDGCSTSCAIEHGYSCTGTPSVCSRRCGDGVIAVNEVCDDGNTTSGDGCSASCTMESNFTCTGEPSVCTTPCGNGQLGPGEYCDDNNRTAGDGCSPTCTVEDTWHCSGQPSVCTKVPDVPAIQGEASAGHADVQWRWNVPVATARFHHRLDGSVPVDVDTSVTSFAVPNLSTGGHVFEVQACNAEGSCSAWGSFSTTVESFLPRPGYTGPWTGVKRVLAATPLGNVVPLVCHACFSASAASAAENLTATQARLDDAITKGADVLDLVVKDVDGVAYVDGDDDAVTTVAKLQDVLAHPELRQAEALLSLRFHESTDGTRLVGSVLDALELQRADCVKNGRPVLLRALHARRQALLDVKAQLAAHPFLAPYVRLVESFDGTEAAGLAAFQALLKAAKDDGFHAVELPHQDARLLAKVAYARSQGLGVLLGTIPDNQGDILLGSLREEVDGLSTDFAVDKARAVLTATTSLAYLNAWNQPSAATHINYLRTDPTVYPASMNVAGAPHSATHSTGEGFFGTALTFDGASHEALTLYDADPAPNQGVLVAVHVKFGNLLLATGDTQAIVDKAQAGGYSLELTRDAGQDPVLHFGIFSGASYRYATFPVSRLNTTDTFYIVGAYDGQGDVWLFVNGSAEFTTRPGAFTGAGITNDMPITVGADPEPGNISRLWFTGEIQQAMVQAWPHR